MNCLVIGCGGIGKRHIDNLLHLGHAVWAEDIVEERIPSNIKIYPTKQCGIDAVFICTPPETHINLIDTWRHKHLFVEKPLFVKFDEDDERILKRRELFNKQCDKIDMVACNMRFNPLIQRAKEIIDQNILGQILSIKVDFGFDWQQWYGGNTEGKSFPGIALDCIHDIDILRWLHFDDSLPLFMQPGNINDDCSIQWWALSNIKFFESRFIGVINVIGSTKLDSHGQSIRFNIHLDYFRKEKKRQIEWIGTEGTLTFIDNRSLLDLHDEYGLYLNDVSVGEYLKDQYDSNYPYLDQLKYFFECIEKGEQTFNSIEYATETNKWALEMQQ